MSGPFHWNDYEEDPEFEAFEKRSRRKSKPRPKPQPEEPDPAPDDDAGMFHPSFAGSRHERAWIREHLGRFYDDHLIADVVRPVRGGKEATVYCCRAHPSTGERLLAAKVYRPREFRTMRNDALYREGRLAKNEAGKEVRDRRVKSAIAKRSKVGLAILHASWLGHEYEILRRMHEAGADVPRPVAREENAILMGYVGHEDAAAPTLSQVALAREEAPAVFEAVLRNVETLLACGWVHGDLSAYNVLYWEGRITLIDFPQAVDPFRNRNAFDLFRRDLERLCGYFARHGFRADPMRLATDLWGKHRLPVE
jgi:RIO kinase 1